MKNGFPIKIARYFLCVLLFFSLACFLVMVENVSRAVSVLDNGIAVPSRGEILSSLKQVLNRWGIPGAVVSLRWADGAVNFGIGCRGLSIGGDCVRFQGDEIVPLASLSKLVTAAAVERAVNDGVMSFLSVVGLKGHQVFMFDEVPGSPVFTIAQLLRHRAGFGLVGGGDPMFLEPPMCASEEGLPLEAALVYAPDSRMQYANIGYCLLARLVEQSVDTAVKPYLMRYYPASSSLAHEKGDSVERLNKVQYFLVDASGVWQARLPNLDNFYGAGEWVDSVGDFGKLLDQAFRDRRFDLRPDPLLKDTAVGCNRREWRGCHGSGFYVQLSRRGHLAYVRSGSLPGLSAVAVMTKSYTAVVVANGRRDSYWLRIVDDLGQAVVSVLDRWESYRGASVDRVPGCDVSIGCSPGRIREAGVVDASATQRVQPDEQP